MRPAVTDLVDRGARTGDIAAKTLTGARNSALETAERIAREQGADGAADAIHAARGATGILEPAELPIADYDDLNVNEAVTAIRDLTDPTDIRVIVAYEEANKQRARVVSAAQTRLAAIAQEVVGIG